MPELPEVETLRRGLEQHLVGRVLGETRVLVPKMLKGTAGDADVFGAGLRGSRIESVGRRGKHLIIALENGYYLLFHLNMRGQLRMTASDAPVDNYLAAAFPLDNGSELRFHDIWRWGEMRLVSPEELAQHPSLIGMGPEPLSGTWTAEQFFAGLAKRPKTAIKAVLLDQSVVAGVGNIYADESLFRAAIQPVRPAGSLTMAETSRLRNEIYAVLTEAVEGGGTTSNNYVDAEGQIGRYTPRVYDRGGKPCVTCGESLTRIRVTGRGTVYCASCQK
ncbi:MAG: bifunctional DNA-formamidopyrimidine glycosylase/DNA-(apurinic or apyrimidinic site) lyase [Janthinobacterium lividum]